MEACLRVAIQKSGRLSDRSFAMLDECGISFDRRLETLLLPSMTFPMEVMLVRSDDIPAYIRDGVCDLGIVGRNVISEKTEPGDLTELRSLDFGYCRLSMALPKSALEPDAEFTKNSLANKKFATSYPRTLSKFLQQNDIPAEIVEISGSVEIAPSLSIADGVCDLVSSGATLRANGLKEVYTILESQAVLATGPGSLAPDKQAILDQLSVRLSGVLKAQRTKYIMMNAPTSALAEIKRILPGMEEPTIVPLTAPDKVAIHAVAQENMFWETMERLKQIGASSILVTPIEKIIE